MTKTISTFSVSSFACHYIRPRGEIFLRRRFIDDENKLMFFHLSVENYLFIITQSQRHKVSSGRRFILITMSIQCFVLLFSTSMSKNNIQALSLPFLILRPSRCRIYVVSPRFGNYNARRECSTCSQRVFSI